MDAARGEEGGSEGGRRRAPNLKRSLPTLIRPSQLSISQASVRKEAQASGSTASAASWLPQREAAGLGWEEQEKQGCVWGPGTSLGLGMVLECHAERVEENERGRYEVIVGVTRCSAEHAGVKCRGRCMLKQNG